MAFVLTVYSRLVLTLSSGSCSANARRNLANAKKVLIQCECINIDVCWFCLFNETRRIPASCRKWPTDVRLCELTIAILITLCFCMNPIYMDAFRGHQSFAIGSRVVSMVRIEMENRI